MYCRDRCPVLGDGRFRCRRAAAQSVRSATELSGIAVAEIAWARSCTGALRVSRGVRFLARRLHQFRATSKVGQSSALELLQHAGMAVTAPDYRSNPTCSTRGNRIFATLLVVSGEHQA